MLDQRDAVQRQAAQRPAFVEAGHQLGPRARRHRIQRPLQAIDRVKGRVGAERHRVEVRVRHRLRPVHAIGRYLPATHRRQARKHGQQGIVFDHATGAAGDVAFEVVGGFLDQPGLGLRFCLLGGWLPPGSNAGVGVGISNSENNS